MELEFMSDEEIAAYIASLPYSYEMSAEEAEQADKDEKSGITRRSRTAIETDNHD